MESIKNFVQLSQGKFRDKEFGDFFYRAVTKDIEKADWVLTHFLDYIKVSTPIRKMNTVHTLIEKLLKRYRAQLEEKKIEVFKHFGNDLPEVTVPDEQLRYILDTLVQYAMASLPLHGSIEFLTRPVDSQKLAHQDQILSKQDGKYVEISVAFTGFKKPGARLETPPSREGIIPDLELRLVEDVIKRNHGAIKFMEEAEKTKTYISMKFPGERRKRVYYQTVN
ncbi:MAG: hypothetical protein QME90_16445 [Thermodesulfobacteriota bacterium]|nr:hypothetical protein [Thermodesulfobacteriota bacterium]